MVVDFRDALLEREVLLLDVVDILSGFRDRRLEAAVPSVDVTIFSNFQIVFLMTTTLCQQYTVEHPKKIP